MPRDLPRGASLYRLFAAAVLVAAQSAEAAPPMKWTQPGSPRRVVVLCDDFDQDTALVTAPLDEPSQGKSVFKAYDFEGKPVPCSVVHTTASKASVLISADSSADRRNRMFAVYYGGTNAPGDQAAANGAGSRPVMIELYAARSRAIPNTWEKMRYMYCETGRAIVRCTGTELGAPPSGYAWGGGGMGRMLLAKTIALFPEKGVYRFAVSCADAGFLLVDNKVVAESPGEHGLKEWVKGKEFSFESGPHEMLFLHRSQKQVDARIGWQTPSAREIAPIPSSCFITSYEPGYARLERIDRTLNAGFIFDVLPAYSFRGSGSLFVPVKFTDISGNWLGVTTDAKWFFRNNGEVPIVPDKSADSGSGGGWTADLPRSAGRPVTHVFAGENVHRARLEIKDELGFESSVEREIDCRNVHRKVFAFNAVPFSFPPACYQKDVIEPGLLLLGSPDRTHGFTVAWTVRSLSGPSIERSTNVSLSATAVGVSMAKGAAGDFAEIAWKVMHMNVEIAGGKIMFQHFPFAAEPARAVESRLYDADGNQLVLVCGNFPARNERKPVRRHRNVGKIAWVDDTFDVPGALGTQSNKVADVLMKVMEWRGRPEVVLRKIPAWQSMSGTYGPVGRIVKAHAAIDENADLIVISLGLPDMLMDCRAEEFERHVAAVVDSVSSKFRKPVILVTPPPYPSALQKVRPYAQAIRKVADGRNIPVADVYSAFMGMGDASRFFRGKDFELSDTGVNLTAQVIARSLLSE